MGGSLGWGLRIFGVSAGMVGQLWAREGDWIKLNGSYLRYPGALVEMKTVADTDEYAWGVGKGKAMRATKAERDSIIHEWTGTSAEGRRNFRRDLGCFIQHSWEPNVAPYYDVKTKELNFLAVRNIYVGDRILADYGVEYWTKAGVDPIEIPLNGPLDPILREAKEEETETETETEEEGADVFAWVAQHAAAMAPYVGGSDEEEELPEGEEYEADLGDEVYNQYHRLVMINNAPASDSDSDVAEGSDVPLTPGGHM